MNLLKTYGRMEAENGQPGLSKLLSGEHNRVYPLKDGDVRAAGKPVITSITDEAYVHMFQSFDGDEIQSILDKAIGVSPGKPDGISSNDLIGVIENDFKPGLKVCVAFLPFDDFGDEKDEMDEEDFAAWAEVGSFVRRLIVDPTDNLSQGFGEADGYYFDYLPDCLKRDVEEGGCTFTLDYPRQVGDPINKEWFLAKYKKAVANLRAMLMPYNLN